MAKKKASKSQGGGPVRVEMRKTEPRPMSAAASSIASGSISPPPDPRVIFLQTDALGSSGIKIYAGYFAEEYLLNELQGTAAADLYDRMRRSDAKVKMCLNAVKTPIIAANWEIAPFDTASDEAKLHAGFIEHVLFKDMDRPFSKTEQLSLADFGYVVQEVTYKPVMGHPKYGDYIGIRSLGWRSPRSILYWRLDPTDGRLDHVRQLITGDLERYVDIPGQFLLVASLEKEGDLYEGVSLLRSCLGAWKRKNLYLKLMAIGGERNAVPTPTAEIPAGKQNTAEYQNLIRSLQNYTSHENAYLTFPEGWKIDFLKSNFDPEKLKTMIDFEDSQIVSAFMANFLLLGSTQSGSRAVSMDQSEFFLGSIQYLADEAVSALNHKLIPDLIKMKFGPQAAYPRLQITGIQDRGGKEFAESMKLLAEAQVIQPDDDLEAHVRRRYNVPKKSDQGVRIAKPPADLQPGTNVVKTGVSQKEAPTEKLSERVREHVKKKRSGSPVMTMTTPGTRETGSFS